MQLSSWRTRAVKNLQRADALLNKHSRRSLRNASLDALFIAVSAVIAPLQLQFKCRRCSGARDGKSVTIRRQLATSR